MKLRLLLICLICIHTKLSFSQYLVINFSDGSQLDYGIQQVEKVRFENDFMLLHLTDETIVSWGLGLIQNYFHSESGLGMTINSPLNLDPIVTVFPNPSNGAFNLTYNLFHPAEVKITVFNNDGKVIFEKTIQHNQHGEQQLMIQLETPAKGAYSCLIETDQLRVIKKIIVQNPN
jgi:hypothetical protein